MRQIDHPRMRFWYGDVVNAELVNTLVAEADYVVHFAAETHVTRSIFDNRLFFHTDVMGAHTVSNAVLKANGRVRRFIHISSSEVYGTAEKPLMDEEHPLKPMSPYACWSSTFRTIRAARRSTPPTSRSSRNSCATRASGCCPTKSTSTCCSTAAGTTAC